VMDEKMKDSVKITVIATGFKEVRSARHRTQEVHTSFASAHDDAMDFPDGLGRQGSRAEPPEHIMSEPSMSERMTSERMTDDRGYADDVAPMPMAHASDHVAADVISLDTMRNAMVTNLSANFEQDDLDVPAFLRKRNDVM